MSYRGPTPDIVIVGGGSAGWMTASLLLHGLGDSGSRITLIESGNISTIGVGEGTTPLFKRFLNYLGITEAQFMSTCNATIKTGINFPGWTGSDEFPAYFHPFDAPGYRQYVQQFFNNCDHRRHGEMADTEPGNYFFNTELAAQRRVPAGPPLFDPGNIDYAYHFDTGLLAVFLKKRCLAGGVSHIIDNVTDVICNDNGDITYLVTAESGKLFADYFVDCSGFAKLLIGKTLGAESISYKPRLFNDRAVVIRTPDTEQGDLPPFTESRALKCGWAWRIPLRDKISWGYVYSADYSSKDDAEQELRGLIGAAAAHQSSLYIKLETGRVMEHWKNNCVAIGLSQGFIEPLEATALGLTQFSINRFITHFARGGFQPVYRDHYNSIVNEAFDATINYIQMHYKLTTRIDTPYWRDCASNENITDAMRAVIAGWDDGSTDFISVLKRFVHRSSYAPYSWYCIFAGMGRFPETTLGRPGQHAVNPYRGEVGNYYGHRQFLENIR